MTHKSFIWSILVLFLFVAPIFAETEAGGESETEEVGMIKVTFLKRTGIASYTVVDTNGVEFVNGTEVADGTVLFITPHIAQSDYAVYQMTRLLPRAIISRENSTTTYSQLAYTLNKETGIYRVQIKKYNNKSLPVEIDANIETYVDISTSIEGEGSVEIVEEGRSYETYEVNGKKYYNRNYEYTFNVTPGEGYYFSSAKVHGKENTYVGKTIVNNRVTKFNVKSLTNHFTMDVVFKESSNEVTNAANPRCIVTNLPATAEFGNNVSFKLACDSDEIKVNYVGYSCDGSTYSIKPAEDSTYTFVKKDCATSIVTDVLYKVEVVDDGESGVGSLNSKVNYVRPTYLANIYAIYPDPTDYMRYLDYSYKLNGEVKTGSENFITTCNLKENCFKTDFKMPEAPVTVKIFRREVSSSSVQASSSSEATSSSSVSTSSSSSEAANSSSAALSSSSVALSSSSSVASSSAAASSSSSEGAESSSSSEEIDDSEITFIAKMQANAFNVSVINRNLLIESALTGTPYAIMDLQGRVIISGHVESASFGIALPRAGRYLIRIAGQVQPITMK